MSLSVNLKKRLHSFSAEIGLSIGEEILVLFGPSGAGKSLLLNMISGIIAPDDGVVNIDHRDVYNSDKGIEIPIRLRRIGYLFQDYTLFPHMTVYENIAYGMSGLKKHAVRTKVEELLGLMRLAGLEERYPHEISGGQKQRAALARTLATEPRLLLLDEPFSALDYQVREKLRSDLMLIHQRYPITTIFVTHDLEEAFVMGEKVAIINNGRLEQVGSREEVFYQPKTRSVAKLLGTRNIFKGRVSRVRGVELTIETDEIGEVKATIDPIMHIHKGQLVSFSIRPEEIMIIRPDRPIDKKVRDNILEGVVDATVGKGTSHTIFFRTSDGKASLKIEMPNFAYKKIKPVKGNGIAVSLKKESIWIIPSN